MCLQGSILGSWLAITWTGFPPASLCSIARPQRLFNQTPRGADASALLYSLVQTAVANNLEPFNYLKYLFTEIPKLGRHYELDALDQFLPWNLTEIIEPLNQAA
jgi:transposase